MIRSSAAVGEAFSERELEILSALAEGLSNQEIADRLFISLKTVKWYNTQIFTKLGVSNRQEAVEASQRLSLHHPSRLPASIPNNLPVQTTPFIGRRRELNELHAVLADPAIRLITILGPGGMGKTRLSVQVAEEQLARFEDGVFMAKLATLDGSSTVLEAIADLFQLQHYCDAQDELMESVARYLHSKAMLLVLDNFEHLLDDASTVSAILQSAPGVKILVTSRERLNVQGEQVYVLKGLELPEHTPSASEESDAVRLFVQVVQRTQVGYRLSEADWAHVAHICQLVGGMPLALELAAGWMDTLPAERIAAEIAGCIDILETDMRDVPERHRSIRATFDQTWTRLGDEERRVLMCVSVFRGGFTQEAAEAVAGATIRTLRHLSNKALLYRMADDRYSLHELIRQYSEQKLYESGEYDAAVDRYITYFAAYMAQRADAFYDLIDRDTIMKAMRETENAVAAWHHILDLKRFDLLARMRTGVTDFLTICGDTFEQHALFAKAADVVRDALREQPEWAFLHATLRVNLAYISSGILPPEDARRMAEEATRTLEEYGPTEELSYAYLLPSCDAFDGDTIAPSLPMALRAVAIAEQVGSVRYQIKALSSVVELYLDVGDGASAREYAARLWALTPAPTLDGPLTTTIWSLRLMARLLMHEAKYDEAAHYLQCLLDQLSAYPFVYYEADVRRALSDMYLRQGDREKAKEQHKLSILMHRERARDWQMLGALFGSFARWLLMECGESAYAAEIFSFVHHHPVAPRKYVVHTQRLLDEVRDILSPEAFAAAVERGRHMKLAQVVEDALAYLSA